MPLWLVHSDGASMRGHETEAKSPQVRRAGAPARRKASRRSGSLPGETIVHMEPERLPCASAPTLEDPRLLLEQLVYVLRGRLSSAAVARSPVLLDALERRGVLATEDKNAQALSVIADAVCRVPGRAGTALRLMTGTDHTTSAPRTTREFITNEMGSVLDTRNSPQGLGSRRVQQLEIALLGPLVAFELGLIEALPTHPASFAHLLEEAPQALPSPRQLPVFVQYCNPELFRIAGLEPLLHDNAQMFKFLKSATRLALLLTDDSVLFPASYLFEVDAFPTFLSDAGAVRELGLLGFVSPTPDLADYQAMKEPSIDRTAVTPITLEPSPG